MWLLRANHYQPSACISDGRDSRTGLDLNSGLMRFVTPRRFLMMFWLETAAPTGVKFRNKTVCLVLVL
jgi:hypothetical protein